MNSLGNKFSYIQTCSSLKNFRFILFEKIHHSFIQEIFFMCSCSYMPSPRKTAMNITDQSLCLCGLYVLEEGEIVTKYTGTFM